MKMAPPFSFCMHASRKGIMWFFLYPGTGVLSHQPVTWVPGHQIRISPPGS